MWCRPSCRRAYGDPEAFAFLNTDPLTDEPVRYNPCEALHYVVNLKHAPPGELEDVQRAIEMTSEASGIEFLYEGETSESPTARRPLYQPRRYGRRWAPILIGWLPQLELGRTISFEHPAGRGGSGYARNEDGELVYVSGQVVLNADVDLDAGFGPGNNWGTCSFTRSATSWDSPMSTTDFRSCTATFRTTRPSGGQETETAFAD